MNGKHIFLDSNIIVYAHDVDAKDKYKIANDKILNLWKQELQPSISIQVLQECYVTFIRKNLSLKVARDLVLNYLQWNVVDNDQSLLIDAIAIQERWKVSFWDAIILAAAKKAKADIIWSEDFNTDQDYDGIRVINPLIE